LLLKLILAFSNSRQVSLGKVAHPLFPVYDCTENTKKTEKTDDLLSERNALFTFHFFFPQRSMMCVLKNTPSEDWIQYSQYIHQWIHEGRAREDLAVIFVMTADTNFFNF